MSLIRIAILFFACFIALPMSLTWAAPENQCESRMILEDPFLEGLPATDPERIAYIKKRITTSRVYILANIGNLGIQDQKAIVEIAKELAASIPEDNRIMISSSISKHIQNFKIESEKDRLEIAYLAVAHQDIYFGDSFRNYKITDPKEHLKLAILATQQNLSISSNLRNFSIPLESDRIELAKLVISRRADEFLLHSTQFKIQDQNILFELIKSALGKGEHNPANQTDLFQFDDERKRIELAKIIAGTDHFIGGSIPHYHITDQDALFEIAKMEASKTQPDGFAHDFKLYNIQSEARRIEIARIISTRVNQIRNLPPHIKSFGIQDEKIRIELALAAAKYNGHLTARYIDQFEIQDQKALEQIAKVAVSQNIRAIEHYKYNFNINNTRFLLELAESVAQNVGRDIIGYLHYFEVTDPQKVAAILKIAFLSQPRKFLDPQLSRHCDEFSRFYDFNLLAPYMAHDSVVLKFFIGKILGLRNFDLQTKPLSNLLSLLRHFGFEQFEPILKDSSQHAQVQISLFQEVWRILYSEDPDRIAKLSGRKHSLAVLEMSLGLPDHSLDSWAKLSNDRKNTFYELALEVAQLTPQVLSNISGAEKLLVKKDGYQILRLIRDIAQLDSYSLEAIRSVFADLSSTEEKLKDLYIEKLKDVLQNPTLNFNYEQLMQLQDKWANLDPVFTLIARFNGNTEWKKEIGILTQVFQSELQNGFEKLKFHQGFNDEDQQRLTHQLGFLTEQERDLWSKARSKVQIVDLSGKMNVFDKDAQFYSALRYNLEPHIEVLVKMGQHTKKPIPFESLLTPGFDYRAVLKGLYKDGYSEEQIVYEIFHFLNKCTLGNKVAKTEQVLKFFDASADVIIDGAINIPQIRLDIKQLLKYFEREPSPGKGRLIVFTTTLKDAKSLLTVGDLVDASSCQNYKTGSHIETLLGYVLDANVQAVVSYALGINSFKNEKEFLEVASIIEKNPSAITFDPDKQKFTVISGNRKIISKVVEKGHSRQILKLGQASDGRPGLRLERSYDQNHATLHFMHEQAQQILKDLSKDLKTSPGSIHISRSRNVGGIYSDACGGVMKGAYEIK